MVGRLARVFLVVVSTAMAVSASHTSPAVIAQTSGAGRASLSGVVVDAASGRPIGGATVDLNVVPAGPTDLPLENPRDRKFDYVPPPQARTDAAGRFTFGDLTAGTYFLTGYKDGWQIGYHSATGSRHGEWITVQPGVRFKTARIALPRGASISGRILGVRHEPLPGVDIAVFDAVAVEGRARYRRVGWEHADDRGQFFVSLGSAEYVVCAVVPEHARVGSPKLPPRDGETFVYQTTCFPRVLSPGEATPFRLSAGEERTGVDIELRETRAFRVSGQVGTGWRFPTTRVELWRPSSDLLEPGPAIRTAARNGEFSANGVPPGAYRLRAENNVDVVVRPSHSSPVIGDVSSWPVHTAEMDIVVTDRDLNITPHLKSAARLSGTVRFVDGEPPSLPALREHNVIVRDLERSRDDDRGVFQQGGTFLTEPILPGRYTISSDTPHGWRLHSVMAGSRDVADHPLEVGLRDIDDLVITFTRRPGAQVIGRVLAATTLTRQVLVVAFPTDRDLWSGVGPSRRIRRSETGRDGAFAFENLPAGAYHLAAIERPQWRELSTPAGFLLMAATSTTVVVAEGETRAVDVRLSMVNR
jgi:hypothetical protein